MKLHDPLQLHFKKLSPDQKKALLRLKLLTVDDLLHYFPSRYGDTANVQTIAGAQADTSAVFFGKLTKAKAKKTFRSRMPVTEGTIEDETGHIKVIWFNQPYIAKMIAEDAFVRVEGKIIERNGELSMSNPKIETVATLPTSVGSSLFTEESNANEALLYPVYPETKGVTTNWIYHALDRIFKSDVLEKVVEPLPADILKTYNLPTLRTALIWIHRPKNQDNALSARKRFSFEEVFYIQLRKQQDRKKVLKEKALVIAPNEKKMKDFIGRFPFSLTSAQAGAVEAIMGDFKKGTPMSRLLEGDVGSGKTAVAAAAVYAAAATGLQTAYMVPTEILAKQHFESFIKYFAHLNVQIALITGSGCKKFPSKVDPTSWTTISRTQLLKWVANGEIPIVIGTHSLIQKSVIFKKLALAIIDEQHRFGTVQRQKLARKEKELPHLLSMTATPIPRTLALTIYGDLDLTLLDEMPKGRKQVITEIVLTGEKTREETYEKIRAELRAGRQAYVICPRIAEPDPDKEAVLNVRSVKEEAARLQRDIFPEYEIAILHSKMTPAEKERTMEEFEKHEIKILVSTSVVEVGVNVPNATVMIIEGAERFGLAQLHQLRGRVVRSNDQAYCYVFAETKSQKTIDRLKAFKKAKNGFELSEYDLSLRGAGELYGGKQWGLSDLGMEALRNLKMVEAARKEATALIEKDLTLSKYPLLQAKLASTQEIHFE